MFAGDAEQVENHLNRLLEKYVSIRDFTTNAPKETYYHSFMNVLLLNGSAEIREQESNFESGNGYIDLIVKAQDSRHTIVINRSLTKNTQNHMFREIKSKTSLPTGYVSAGKNAVLH